MSIKYKYYIYAAICYIILSSPRSEAQWYNTIDQQQQNAVMYENQQRIQQQQQQQWMFQQQQLEAQRHQQQYMQQLNSRHNNTNQINNGSCIGVLCR